MSTDSRDAVAADAARLAPERRRAGPALSTSLVGVAERYALGALVVAVCIIFSVLPSTSATFPTLINLKQVLVNQAAVIILAVGEIFPLVTGSFDLSVGAVSGVSAVATATTMSRFGLPLVVALIVGVGLGAVIGGFNGVLIAKGKLNPFIVTLGMNTLLIGAVTWYTQGNNIDTGISQDLDRFGVASWLGVPQVLYLVVVVVLAGWYLLGHTPFGRYLHALGSNTRAAQLVGINVSRLVFISFLTSGALAGVAGVVIVAVNNGAVISAGPQLLFPMLTAVFLGATTVSPGRYNVIGTVIGVLFVAASVSGLVLAGAADWVNDVFNGAALIVAVAISTFLARQRRGA
jgi:ribose transport system permease protein